MTENRLMHGTYSLTEAKRLLGIYTAGHFDLYMLVGNRKASCRAHLMSMLLGKKVPQRAAGFSALRNEFYKQAGIKPDCFAAQEEEFETWCRGK